MLFTIAEIVIDFVAILAGVGGVACIIYFAAILLKERREARDRLIAARVDWALRNARVVTVSEAPRRPAAPRLRPARPIQHRT